MLYAGVDTHKKYSKVVVTDGTGNRVAEASLANDYLLFKNSLVIQKNQLKLWSRLAEHGVSFMISLKALG